MDALRGVRQDFARQGVSSERAAEDIARGLCKTKPPRYIYTGSWLFYSLVMGFLQVIHF